mgnify:CR=1 FL=1
MIGALKATPTICVQQHDCVATLIGKASSENEGGGRGGVVPRIVLVVVRVHVDVKNCLLHALARTYAHFFISILYVNFQFGSNEYSDYFGTPPP